jgi:hypothetical protein
MSLGNIRRHGAGPSQSWPDDGKSLTVARKPTLWEIEAQLLELFAELEAIPDNEPVPEALLSLVFDCMEASRDKRDALAGARKRKEFAIAALEQRADDARAKAEVASRALKRLDAYILSILDAQGVKRLDGDQYKIGWQQNPPRVEIVPEVFELSHADGRFVRTKIIREPDKKAVREAIEAGESVMGAALVEGSRRVTIR